MTTTAIDDDTALPGLAYRVRVEHYGLPYAPAGAAAIGRDDFGYPEVVHFDYLRVTGDSLEQALGKVRDRHRQRYPDGDFHVRLLGYTLDGVPIAQPLALLSFERYGEHGWEWEVGDLALDTGPGPTVRWRTDSGGQGLWRWACGDRLWVQTHGHLQWEAEGGAEWLIRRWGLADRRGQHAAQQADDDLITADEVLAVLRERGRPITKPTLHNYTSSPPPGWPGVVKRVGRTPLWSRTAIEAYAAAAPARRGGAR